MKAATDFLKDKTIRLILIFVFLGLLLRLFLMPATLHVDLLSASFRQYLFIDNKVFRLFMLPEVFLSGYFVLIKPYIRLIPEVMNKAIEAGRYGIFAEATGTVDLFSRSSIAMRTLFVLKLPYLFFEILFIPVAFKIFINNRERLWFFALWWLNPLILYSTYVWGRYDIYAIFLILISLYYARQKRDIQSLIFLGAAIACRESFVLVLPLYLMYFHRKYTKLIIGIFITFIPVILSLIIFNVLKSFNYDTTSSLAVDSTIYSFSADYILKSTLGSSWLEVSPVIVLLPLFYYFYYKKKQKSFLSLVYSSSSVLIVFLSLSYIHAHYLSWLVPFLFYMIIFNKKLLWLIIVYLFFSFLYFDAYFGANISLAMFRPLNFEFFSNIGSIADTLFLTIRKGNLLIVLNTIRLTLAGIIVYLLLKENYEIKTKN